MERQSSVAQPDSRSFSSEATGTRGRIRYVTLQQTREGQAGHAHVLEIVKGLRRLGWEVELFSPSYGDKRPSVFARLAEAARVQRDALRGAGRGDIVYCRSHVLMFPLTVVAAARRLHVTHEVNGPYEDMFIAWPATRALRPLLTGMLRWQYRRASAVIAVTDGLAEWLARETGRGDIAVVGNGADVEVFRPCGVRADEPPYAVFVGALAPWQGIGTVLEAVRSRYWPAGVRLVVAGSGRLGSDVAAAAAGDERVTYLGRVAYRDVPALVSGALLGFVPMTDLEGRASTGLSPLKLYETLACGRPAVVSDLPGQADFVRAELCGLVFPPGDADALAAAVASLAADPEEAAAMGERGRRAVVARHSWECRSRETDAILRRVLGDVDSLDG